MLFSLAALLIVLPNFSYTGYLYYRSLEKMPGLESAQSVTPFHIYAPTQLPDDYLWRGVTIGGELSFGQTTGIKIHFGCKLEKKFQEPIFPPIILQESAGLNELTEKMILENLGEDVEAQKIQKQPVSTAKNGYGFWLETSLIRSLTFLTSDNVLIDIITLSKLDPYSLDYLLTIANSLQ